MGWSSAEHPVHAGVGENHGNTCDTEGTDDHHSTHDSRTYSKLRRRQGLVVHEGVLFRHRQSHSGRYNPHSSLVFHHQL